MKKNYLYYLKTLRSFLAILGLIIIFNENARSQPPKPKMWSPRAQGDVLKRNFIVGKQTVLNAYLAANKINKDETDSIFYDINAFQGMLKYFKDTYNNDSNPDKNIKYLYFVIASYDDVEASPVPTGYGGLLTIIFCQADNMRNILGYFTIPPNTTQFDKSTCSLAPQVANQWRSNYTSNKMRSLWPTLGSHQNDYDNQVSGMPSDTRAVCHDFSDLTELETEIVYQASMKRGYKRITSGIKAFFASYDENGTIDEYGKLIYKDRLSIQFEFTQKNPKGIDEVYYLDNTYKFFKRPDAPKNGSAGFLNNGQLCPPATNCPVP